MDCKQIKEKLSAYMDAELDAAGRRQVDEHLEACESCAADLRRMEAVWELIAGVDAPEPPEALPEKITAGLSLNREPEAEAGRVALKTLLAWPMNAAAALAVVLGIVLGFVLGMVYDRGGAKQEETQTEQGYYKTYSEEFTQVFSELPTYSPGYYLVEFVSNGEDKEDSPKEDGQ